MVDLDLCAVLIALACLGGAAHGKVLDGAAKACHLVALEVGEDHHGRRFHDFRGDLHFLEVLGIDGHRNLVLAEEAVRNDNGSVHNARSKAVAQGRVQMVHGVVAGAVIEGGGIGQEGLCACGTHLVHHHLHELGIKMGVVAGLAEVQLDGTGLILHHHLGQLHEREQAGNLGFLGLGGFATGHGIEVDCRSHGFRYSLQNG